MSCCRRWRRCGEQRAAGRALTQLAGPNWCSAAARRPRRPTPSSTRWCGMRPTEPAQEPAPAAACPYRRGPGESTSRRRWRPSPSCSPSTAPRRDWPSRQSATGPGRAAGARALGKAEAIAQLRRGWSCSAACPTSPERREPRARPAGRLGGADAAQGFAAPEAGRPTRGRASCAAELGATPSSSRCSRPMGVPSPCGPSTSAHEVGEELLRRGGAQDGDGARSGTAPSELLCSSGASSAASRAPLEAGLALYDPVRHRSLAFLYVPASACACSARTCSALFMFLGYPDQALAGGEALGAARGSAIPYAWPTARCCRLLFPSPARGRSCKMSKPRAERWRPGDGIGFPHLAWGGEGSGGGLTRGAPARRTGSRHSVRAGVGYPSHGRTDAGLSLTF